MKISLKFFGQLGRLAGNHSGECVCPDGASIVEVLNGALKDCDPAAREIVFNEERQLRPSLIVLVNGLPVAKDAATILKDGDQVTLLTAIAGG